MCTEIDNGRLREVGAMLARTDHKNGRPRTDSARFWAPHFRDGYDEERERLGACAPDAHDWQPARVTSESPAALLRVRSIGAWVYVCSRCGVWKDRHE